MTPEIREVLRRAVDVARCYTAFQELEGFRKENQFSTLATAIENLRNSLDDAVADLALIVK